MSETQLDRIERTLNKFVDYVQRKLVEHDGQFAKVDQKFEHINRKFEQVDRRFDTLTGEVSVFRREVNQRFDAVDARLVELARA